MRIYSDEGMMMEMELEFGRWSPDRMEAYLSVMLKVAVLKLRNDSLCFN